MKCTAIFFCLTTLFLSSGHLNADDIFGIDCHRETRKSSVWAGFGHLNARAQEIVYGGPGGKGGNEASHLTWDADNALTFNLGFEGEINDRWSLFGKGVFSLSADNSNMIDLDWTDPTTSAWTHRSTHPNTDLNHYVQIDLGVDYKMYETEKATFRFRTGYRYTDISFDAYGGTGIYSVGGFRDTNFVFPNRVGISYRQKLPGFYIGPQINWAIGSKLTLNMGAIAGLTFNPEARDHHWLRGILFEDYLNSSAFYGANVGFEYALKESTILYIEGSYDRYNRSTGYSHVTSQTIYGVTPEGSAGAELDTLQINAGIKINSWHKELFSQNKKLF